MPSSGTSTSKFIGRGTYGCTFSPPIPCKTNLQKDTKKKLLGKIFYNSKEMISELEIYQKIMKIDPEGKLFPKMFSVFGLTLSDKVLCYLLGAQLACNDGRHSLVRGVLEYWRIFIHSLTRKEFHVSMFSNINALEYRYPQSRVS